MTDVANGEAPPVEGIAVTINGKEIVADKGELVIDAAERNGIYIPRFCYHPRMKPVGMCRMCIVEIDTGRGPALQPSCMLECTPDMKVDTESPVTKKAQDGVLEFLLINHPLDCPVCDKGGECPLQDQTIAYGPGESRFVEEKRHLEKPIAISDVVYLDRERCILCDRCTRFAKDVAGDPLIHFLHRGNNTEVNTFPNEPFASYFSGNTVQICPVGALTAKPYRFKARPWDLEQAESTCQSCAVGCRVAIQSSRNEVLRYLGVDIDPVNWGWLCDKGRFDFEAVNSDERLRDPLLRRGDSFVAARWTDALRAAASAVQKAVNAAGADGIGVIGGARLTNEDAYAWAKFAKGLLGTDNVDCQLADGLPAASVFGLPKATIDDVCRPGGTVIVVGPDVKEELPVLFLRLRHAAVEDRVNIIELAPQPTGLTSLARVSLFHRPGESAEVARALLEGIPAGKDGGGVDPHALTRAQEVLRAADGPVTVVVGRQSIAESGDYVADAAASLLRGLPDATFLTALRRANVHGALDMGLTPGFLPGRVTLDEGRDWFERTWATTPDQSGLDATGILQKAADGQLELLVLLGADPLADFPDRDLATRALAGARTVIAIDLFVTESSGAADILLPAAGYAEVEGTTTNLEGRVSTLNQKVTPPGTARAPWVIAAELAYLLDSDLELESVEQITDEIAQLAPAYTGIDLQLLSGTAGSDGVVAPLPLAAEEAADATADSEAPAAPDGEEGGEAEAGSEDDDTLPDPFAAPTMPRPFVLVPGDPVAPTPVDAYGLRLIAGRKLYDQGTLVQHCGSLAKLLPGTLLRVNSYDTDRLGVATGHQVRVKTPRGVLTAEVTVDDSVPRGSAAVYVNQPGVRINDLIDATQRVTDLRIDSGADA